MEKQQETEEVQAKIQEILEKCKQGEFIFRGEKNKNSKISSGLYRHFCEKQKGKTENPPIQSENFSVLTVEEDYIEEARKHIRSDAPDIEVVTELQHYKGKTNLIDFSRNLYIALFFACEARTKEKGRIIAVNIANLKTTKIDYKKNKEKIFKEDILAGPTGKNPRVIFQSSVFVHPYKGYLEKEQYTSFIIEARLKEKVLEYLKKFCNITTKSIYNDLHGFIEEQKNHSTAEIEFYRGLTLQNEKKWSEAVGYYNKAIKLNPQDANAYNNRGNAKARLKEYTEAIKDYNQAIELNLQYAEAYNNRGNAKFYLKQYNEAMKDYNQAIELNLQYAEAYKNRGFAKIHLAQPNTAARDLKYKEAIKDLDKAIELNPQDAEAYEYRGSAQIHLKQFFAAEKDHKKAKELFAQQNSSKNHRKKN